MVKILILAIACVFAVSTASANGQGKRLAPQQEKFGVGADAFDIKPPASAKVPHVFDGVSDMKKAGLCGQQGGKLDIDVETCRKLPNGQVQCKNVCRMPTAEKQ